ncbi:MAG TPA: hypothetical protein VFZ67_08610 [Nitrososphaera sp.]
MTQTIEEEHLPLITQAFDYVREFDPQYNLVDAYNITAKDTEGEIISIYNDPPTIEIWYSNGTGWKGDDIKFTGIPHNFTTANGYVYRDNEIYAPNGTALSSDDVLDYNTDTFG